MTLDSDDPYAALTEALRELQESTEGLRETVHEAVRNGFTGEISILTETIEPPVEKVKKQAIDAVLSYLSPGSPEGKV